jgi:hypothetical protein
MPAAMTSGFYGALEGIRTPAFKSVEAVTIAGSTAALVSETDSLAGSGLGGAGKQGLSPWALGPFRHVAPSY